MGELLKRAEYNGVKAGWDGGFRGIFVWRI